MNMKEYLKTLSPEELEAQAKKIEERNKERLAQKPYNQLYFLGDENECYDFVNKLIENFEWNEITETDLLIRKARTPLLYAIVLYLCTECYPSDRNFINVMKLLEAGIIKEGHYTSPLDIIFEDLEKKDPNHIAVKEYSIFKQNTIENANNIIKNIQINLMDFGWWHTPYEFYNKFHSNKYKVVVLCGSTKFKDTFTLVQKELTLQGKIVLTLGIFEQSDDSKTIDNKTKIMLEEMHNQRIEMADEIFVIDVNGYIGESTKKEINYAKKQNKPITYLSQSKILKNIKKER